MIDATVEKPGKRGPYKKKEAALDYTQLTHADLKRRIQSSPVDSPDCIKALSELNRRHNLRVLRIAKWGTVIAAVGILTRFLSSK